MNNGGTPQSLKFASDTTQGTKHGLKSFNSEDIQQAAAKLVKQLDTTDSFAIIQFGVPTQTNLASLSQTIIQHIQKQGHDTISRVLQDLIEKLKFVKPNELNPAKKSLFNRIFTKSSSSINETLSKYQKLGAQMDKIAANLNYQINILKEDTQMLETLFKKNEEQFKELEIYVAAVELKLIEIKNNELPKLKLQSDQTENETIKQKIEDLVAITDFLEKRQYDLLLSKQITLQNGTQLRLLQTTNKALIENIQTSILTSIPVWRNQIVTSLTLLRQKRVIDTDKQIQQIDTIPLNSLPTDNKQPLETLKKLQSSLISTSLEAIKIDHENQIKRQQAKQEFIKNDENLTKAQKPI